MLPAENVAGFPFAYGIRRGAVGITLEEESAGFLKGQILLQRRRVVDTFVAETRFENAQGATVEIEARSFEFPADGNDVIGVAASDLAEAADAVKKILQ
jgi:hypothetical protein